MEFEFVKPVEAHFQCHECEDGWDPETVQQCVACAATFCRACCSKLQAELSDCSKCKVANPKFCNVHPLVTDMAKGLEVYCPHMMDGCNWVGSRAALVADHQASCPFSPQQVKLKELLSLCSEVAKKLLSSSSAGDSTTTELMEGLLELYDEYRAHAPTNAPNGDNKDDDIEISGFMSALASRNLKGIEVAVLQRELGKVEEQVASKEQEVESLQKTVESQQAEIARGNPPAEQSAPIVPPAASAPGNTPPSAVNPADDSSESWETDSSSSSEVPVRREYPYQPPTTNDWFSRFKTKIKSTLDMMIVKSKTLHPNSFKAKAFAGPEEINTMLAAIGSDLADNPGPEQANRMMSALRFLDRHIEAAAKWPMEPVDIVEEYWKQRQDQRRRVAGSCALAQELDLFDRGAMDAAEDMALVRTTEQVAAAKAKAEAEKAKQEGDEGSDSDAPAVGLDRVPVVKAEHKAEFVLFDWDGPSLMATAGGGSSEEAKPDHMQLKGDSKLQPVMPENSTMEMLRQRLQVHAGLLPCVYNSHVTNDDYRLTPALTPEFAANLASVDETAGDARPAQRTVLNPDLVAKRVSVMLNSTCMSLYLQNPLNFLGAGAGVGCDSCGVAMSVSYQVQASEAETGRDTSAYFGKVTGGWVGFDQCLVCGVYYYQLSQRNLRDFVSGKWEGQHDDVETLPEEQLKLLQRTTPADPPGAAPLLYSPMSFTPSKAKRGGLSPQEYYENAFCSDAALRVKSCRFSTKSNEEGDTMLAAVATVAVAPRGAHLIAWFSGDRADNLPPSQWRKMMRISVVSSLDTPLTKVSLVYNSNQSPMGSFARTDTWQVDEEVHHGHAVGECSLCLEVLDLEEGDCVQTKCRHWFHMKCLQRWIREPSQADNSRCPLCRAENPMEKEDNEQLLEENVFRVTVRPVITTPGTAQPKYLFVGTLISSDGTYENATDVGALQRVEVDVSEE